MTNKETDKYCNLCKRFDTCQSNSSEGCQNYEFYKCETCIDRIVEHDETPRCFREGRPCMDIEYCNNERSTL